MCRWAGDDIRLDIECGGASFHTDCGRDFDRARYLTLSGIPGMHTIQFVLHIIYSHPLS